ncbi:MAG: flagellar biosynthetic protein FliO [Micrococcales bacterium 70-64]|nr:flagellar biosynthetic protein FliO [Leifsonia sp.]ODU64097.1 MAG: flagellar biosynthetic protein FliO [Leifsonia sp. SCN 70-46]OJX85788.1 MAG: flagellar biosynthetic protein FliO [Micrococcales bacterium 70-64]
MDDVFLVLRVIVSLAAVLGVIWYIQRRVSRGSRVKQSKKAITVVGRQGVGARASVAVIDVDGKRFILGVTEHSVNILHTSDTPEAPAEAFSRVLTEEGGDVEIEAVTPPASSSPLAGSILSVDTWRRAFASLKP